MLLFNKRYHFLLVVCKFGGRLWYQRNFEGFLTGLWKSVKMVTLETLHFDNKVLRELPLDPVSDRRTRQVHGACFSLVI